MEIGSVQVYDIHTFTCEHLCDRAAARLVGDTDRGRVEAARRHRQGHKLARARRIAARDDDRAMSRGNDGAFDGRRHLFGATDRVRAERRERIGDRYDGEHVQPFASGVSEATKSAACASQVALETGQRKRSYQTRPLFGGRR